MSREQNLELAHGLREAADWLEQNAYIDAALWAEHQSIAFRCWNKEKFASAARALGTFDKMPERACLKEWYYTISRAFGKFFDIEIRIARESVCRKVKVLKEVDSYECADSLFDSLAEEPVSEPTEVA